MTYHVLFVISIADRVVKIAGITTHPDSAWMLQVGRNLTDAESGAVRAKQYFITDRDAKYTDQFRRVIQRSGTKVSVDRLLGYYDLPSSASWNSKPFDDRQPQR